MKRRLLLVDEDNLVLKALNRSLRKLRDHWEISYAQSHQEALGRLDQTRIDVLITEVHLTSEDSELFLRSFLRKQPHASRIVLTGFTDPNEIFKYAGLAHQLLAKPWEDDTLIETIQRADLINDLLNRDDLRKAVNRIERFPSIPAVYLELTQTLKNPEATVQDVGRIIIRDPLLTLKLMQIVNSPYYGLPMPVNDPHKAVALLGLDIVKGFVLTSGLFQQYENQKMPDLNIDALWQHSMKTANLSRQLARFERFPEETTEVAFIAGLLHDIGKIIIAVNFPQAFRQVHALAATGAIPLWQIEQRVLGASHAQICAYLLCLWGLPLPVIEAVRYHHTPSMKSDPGVDHITLLHVANALARQGQGSDDSPKAAIDATMDADYITRLKLNDRLTRWRRRLAELA